MRKTGIGQAVIMRIVFIAIGLAAVSGPAYAADGWRLALDVGKTRTRSSIGGTSFEMFRAGLQRELGEALWTGENVRLGGYFEASANYWSAEGEDLWGVAFSPVLALYFDTRIGTFTPYVEGGVGGALLSDTEIAGRDLSTTFQFEIRFGAGLRSDSFDLHLRWMHYSNGSIEQPNHGVDALVAGMAFAF